MAKFKPTPTWVRGIYYQGRWANYDRNNPSRSMWIMFAFRSPFSGKRDPFSYSRPQVRGGRWKIRRSPAGPPGRPWRAWSDGIAGKKWSRYFANQEDAAFWAHLVANTYRTHDNKTANALLGMVLKYGQGGEGHKHFPEGWAGKDDEFLTEA